MCHAQSRLTLCDPLTAGSTGSSLRDFSSKRWGLRTESEALKSALPASSSPIQLQLIVARLLQAQLSGASCRLWCLPRLAAVCAGPSWPARRLSQLRWAGPLRFGGGSLTAAGLWRSCVGSWCVGFVLPCVGSVVELAGSRMLARWLCAALASCLQQRGLFQAGH